MDVEALAMQLFSVWYIESGKASSWPTHKSDAAVAVWYWTCCGEDVKNTWRAVATAAITLRETV